MYIYLMIPSTPQPLVGTGFAVYGTYPVPEALRAEPPSRSHPTGYGPSHYTITESAHALRYPPLGTTQFILNQ
jgi:hypothetical protein